jgi:hypothetical protein
MRVLNDASVREDPRDADGSGRRSSVERAAARTLEVLRRHLSRVDGEGPCEATNAQVEGVLAVYAAQDDRSCRLDD